MMLDAWLWLYHAVCFPVYGIAKADRSRYIPLDRGPLRYLNAIERLNCNDCGDAGACRKELARLRAELQP